MACVTSPCVEWSAHARLVDLERVGVGIVARLLAVDLGPQVAVRLEALHREAAHEVVGLVRRRLLRRGRQQVGVLRTSHQVPSASTAISISGR